MKKPIKNRSHEVEFTHKLIAILIIYGILFALSYIVFKT